MTSVFYFRNRRKHFPSWEEGTFFPSRYFQNVPFCKQEREVPVLYPQAETIFWGIWICINWESQAQCYPAAPLYLTCNSEDQTLWRILQLMKCPHITRTVKTKVTFSNAIRYLQMQVSIKWWFPKHRRCLVGSGFTSLNEYCDNLQVVTNTCDKAISWQQNWSFP